MKKFDVKIIGNENRWKKIRIIYANISIVNNYNKYAKIIKVENDGND